MPDFWLTAMKTNEVLSEEVGDFISHLLCSFLELIVEI